MLLAGAEAKANPIRRVVTLLQNMQKEITDEVRKEGEMYKKFECYCKKNSGDLDQKTKEAAALIKRTKALVEGLTAQKKQLKEEIAQHKKDRKKAEADLKATIAKRAEEKKVYDEATKDNRKTLEDLGKAIAALEKGLGKSFLQSNTAAHLQALASINSQALSTLDISDQQMFNSFLQSGAGSSGEIVGILKMIKENINSELGGVVQQEEVAVKAFNTIKSSLLDLVKTSGSSIESKQELSGNVAVKVVEGKNLVSTTEKQMGDDMKTAAELKEACGNRGGEFEERQKDAAAEVQAIGQAIEILNNDDAMDLFKKTDTKAEAFNQLSLIQTRKGPSIASLFKTLDSVAANSPKLAMMAYSAKAQLRTKKVDFSKIIKMIDDMVVLLKQEAEDDIASREDCNTDFNQSEADKKEVEHAITGLSAEIEDAAAVIDTQVTAINKAVKDIADAKSAMAGATKQRQNENAEFVVAVDLNKQAVELIGKAKEKLNAYYNPDLVAKEQRTETTEEAAARVANSFEQLPEGAPEMWDAGKRENKGQKSGSVLSLMDMLANDLNKDTQAMEHAEQTAQRDYEKLSIDLATQVAESSKGKNEAQQTKADTEVEKQTLESTLDMKNEEQADIVKTIADLHAKCDFILSAFEERKASRENEVAGLQKAKAVLSGAKFD